MVATCLFLFASSTDNTPYSLVGDVILVCDRAQCFTLLNSAKNRRPL
jgi:hypothetical protein